MDELFASATEPTPKAKQQYQLLRMYEGLRALENEKEPKLDDWLCLTDAINLMELMVRNMQICEDNSGLLDDATNALKQAAQRYQSLGVLRLDGAGINAVRAVLEDYSSMLETLPHRTIVQCHRLAEKRLLEIRAGKVQPHDVVIK